MFVVGNFLAAVAQLLDYVLWAYIWILFARILASWLNADPYNPIVNFLYTATEPVLERAGRPNLVASLVVRFAHRCAGFADS